MEKMFGPAYTGDPGVPHTDKGVFEGIFWGSVGFSLYSFADPYFWNNASAVNWHDWAMVCENNILKTAIRKKKPYKPRWNKMLTNAERTNYYESWQDYFP